jgi:hypothetical protein
VARAEFSNTVQVSGGSVIGLNAEYGTVNVGTVAVELKIGADPLVYRSGIFASADPNNSDNIYIGLDNTVSATHSFLCIPAGGAFSIDVDSSNDVHIFAKSLSEGQLLHLCEVKK